MQYESELYHHGIKGMKWGVRRKRNTGGPKKESSFHRLNRQHRERYESRYRKTGMSNEAARKKARNRIIAERFVAGVLGTPLTAVLITPAIETVQQEHDRRVEEEVRNAVRK